MAFTHSIVEGLQSLFHNKYLVTAIISVVPMIEVRGAITVGNNLGINPWLAYLLSCCSALIVCPLLLFCLRPCLNALKRTKTFRKLALAAEETFIARAEKIEDKDKEKDDDKDAKKWDKIIGIFLFVAIPLPLTGVWTGSAAAAFLDLEYRYSLPAIVVGNFVAGLIITVLNIILGEYSSMILLVLAAFVVVAIMSFIVIFAKKYRKPRVPCDKDK